MSAHCNHESSPASQLVDVPRYRRILSIALIVNAAMFFVELAGAYRSGSVSLLADAINFAGVSAEFGVIMLLYLKTAWNQRVAQGKTSTEDLLDAIREGAVLRVRPKAMTVAVILAGLFAIMWGTGTGSEVIKRIAAPMVGGMITTPLLSMFAVPAVYLLMRRPRAKRVPRPAFWRRIHATA